MKLLITIPLITFCFSLRAEVAFDGTLGMRTTLEGPHYQINAEWGQQRGANLFHSFQNFNIHENESAIFSGPSYTENIISRVTGGNPSEINGLIRSTIPNANIYLLNPYGILFGPKAQLDISGSFHASTAHYLRLGEEGRFDARQPDHSLLTIAPATAFGFIDNTIAPITMTGYGEVSSKEVSTGLKVPTGKTLSLIGGNLNFKQGSFHQTVTNKEGKSVTTVTPLGSLTASAGRINLASVASKGEVIPTAEDLDVSSLAQLGNISMADKSMIDVSGAGAGSIFIRSGQFIAQDSFLSAKTLADKKGGIVSIETDDMTFSNGSELNTDTKGTGQGADVQIKTKGDTILSGRNSQSNGSRILAQTTSKQADGGKSGNILITAREILLTDDAFVSVDTSGGGQGGDIILTAHGNVTLIGDGTKPLAEISAGTLSKEDGAGTGGSIFIRAKNIILKDGAILDTAARGKGNAGQIRLSAQELIDFHGTGNSKENSVKIKSYAEETSNGGNAGEVFLEAKDILMNDGSYINASTFSSGRAGNIEIHASGTVTLTGTRAEGWATWIGSGSYGRVNGIISGEGGNTLIEAGELNISEGASIASSSAAAKDKISSHAGNVIIRVVGTVRLSGVNPRGETEDGLGSGIYVRTRGMENNAGDGGTLSLEAGSLIIEKGAVISSSTSDYAQGGNIEIKVRDSIHIVGDSVNEPSQEPGSIQEEYRKGFEDDTHKNSVSGIYANSSDTSIQAGEAGHIIVSANTIHLEDKGTISSSTKNAGGGNITVIASDQLYSQKGEITTSVQGGIANGGEITIGSPLFVILNKGIIKAEADQGHGGNIQITSDQFVASHDSLVSASSKIGVDGQVIVNSPVENVSNNLVVTPTKFTAPDIHQTVCSSQDNMGSFIV
ncbi:MAG: hypothetical protein BWK79_16135, partial [Beggiatoa sp. IS2]